MSMSGPAHGGFVSQGARGVGRSVIVTSVPSGWGWRGPSHGYPYHYRRFFPGRYAWRWGYPWTYGYGWYLYPSWGWSVAVGDGDSDPPQTSPAPSYAYTGQSNAYSENAQIQQDEINSLNQEVDRLQEEERESRAPRSTAPASQPSDVLLVFRDKHTEEVQNYAVVGTTFWVFTELRSQKIPVAN